MLPRFQSNSKKPQLNIRNKILTLNTESLWISNRYQCHKETSNHCSRFDEPMLHPWLPHSHTLSKMVSSREDTNEQFDARLRKWLSTPPSGKFKMPLWGKTGMRWRQRCRKYRVDINVSSQRKPGGILKSKTLPKHQKRKIKWSCKSIYKSRLATSRRKIYITYSAIRKRGHMPPINRNMIPLQPSTNSKNKKLPLRKREWPVNSYFLRAPYQSIQPPCRLRPLQVIFIIPNPLLTLHHPINCIQCKQQLNSTQSNTSNLTHTNWNITNWNLKSKLKKLKIHQS